MHALEEELGSRMEAASVAARDAGKRRAQLEQLVADRDEELERKTDQVATLKFPRQNGALFLQFFHLEFLSLSLQRSAAKETPLRGTSLSLEKERRLVRRRYELAQLRSDTTRTPSSPPQGSGSGSGPGPGSADSETGAPVVPPRARKDKPAPPPPKSSSFSFKGAHRRVAPEGAAEPRYS